MTTPAARSTATPSSVRPAAHFTARSTWLNDPNGLLYHEGVYHLFFQNNPSGDTWGNMSWGHATSTDLVSWQEQAVAIPATAEEMVFSGSAVVDTRNTAGFAGPGQTALVAIYTSARPPLDGAPGIQAQALAFSLDAGNTWTRYEGNPVLDIGSTEFRDPKVFWYGGDNGHWVMVAVDAVDRRVVFYTSPNLIDWTLGSRFGPCHAVGGVWECPDLFPLPIKGTQETRWVLIVSLNPGAIAGGSGTQYFVGDFDGTTFIPTRITESTDPADYDWLDYGRDYYAAVSFNNVPDDRRLMIGWASNWDYANETPTGPWRSAMSLVREIELVRTAGDRLRIAQSPILPPEQSPLHVFDLTVPCTPGARTTLVLTGDDSGVERLTITIDGGERSITCDRTQSGAVDFHPAFPSVDWAPLPDQNTEEIDLLIVVDAHIVEIYAGKGLVTLAEQVFPTAPFTRLHRETIHGQK
ncbi:glycoside hydrolase family 32 protein [Arthrobacter burdickii]|uniref:Glycoside hydrolase family 32 protein n=1 Tax=Arthrobacter burdickii TaxID=3035920 RepID=A0ABT8JXJ8_9MICC|nr:glycoside hydrolase family 32 protein [Arthrobacter burdickii]MDN4609895.1 glycoside hydrolase family 32 protein [Arthrobacter burdickii]